MKKSKNLSIVLYVFIVFSLMYTCYVLFTSYSAFTAYYGTGGNLTDVLSYVIGNAYAPLMMTVILYALEEMNEIIRKNFISEEKVEEKQEEVKEGADE